MRTAGVDLASRDDRTALAEISWSAAGAVLESVTMGVGNDRIIAVADDVALIGIDCPLGWPKPFTDLLVAARAGAVTPDAGSTAAQKQALAYRRTDSEVRIATGHWPLSVSADRIAYPAMRCAGLLGRLASNGHRVRRSGVDSRVVEVYPAAALRRWSVPTAGFKTDPAARVELVERLVRLTPWLDWSGFAPLCTEEHDALDAVVCAVVAGAVVRGRTTRPAADLLELADEEGWIHLPDQGFLSDPFG